MAAFTIINHGTNFHREKSGELLSELGRVMAGSEARVNYNRGDPVFIDGDYMINEGPGAGIETRPGQVNPFTMQQRGTLYSGERFLKSHLPRKLGGRSDFRRDFEGHTPKKGGMGTGSVLGSGWDDNIWKTLFILSNKINNFPEKINMIGWSRGAVTCIRLAHHIWTKAKEGLFNPIEINLFLIDPVIGGPTTRKDDMVQICPLVERLVCILAKDDRRATFKPLSVGQLTGFKEAVPNQDIIFLPMPGSHDAQVQKVGGCEDAADLTWNLGYKFLSSLGSQFNGLPQGLRAFNNPAAMCDAYARIITGKPYPRTTYYIDYKKRGFTKHLSRYVDYHQYFINDHHRLVFEYAYPEIYRAVFQGQGAVSGATVQFVADFHPIVFESLEKAGIIKNGKIKTPKRPSGKRYLAKWPRGVPLW